MDQAHVLHEELLIRVLDLDVAHAQLRRNIAVMEWGEVRRAIENSVFWLGRMDNLAVRLELNNAADA